MDERSLEIEMRDAVEEEDRTHYDEYERRVWYNKVLREVIANSTNNNTTLRVHKWQIFVDEPKYNTYNTMTLHKIITPMREYTYSIDPTVFISCLPRTHKCTCDTKNKKKCKCVTKQPYYHSRESCCMSIDSPCERWRACTKDCSQYKSLKKPVALVQPLPDPTFFCDDSLDHEEIDLIDHEESPDSLNHEYVLDLISAEEKAAEEKAAEEAAAAPFEYWD